MGQHSAGILLYRHQDGTVQVLLVHPGGPFWQHKDDGAWSIPKGLCDENEDPLAAAVREFRGETGFQVDGEFIELGELKQPSKKIIHVWALDGDIEVDRIASNTFTLEWPRLSGKIQNYPEVDKGEWFDLEMARNKIINGQVQFLDRLLEKLKSS